MTVPDNFDRPDTVNVPARSARKPARARRSRAASDTSAVVTLTEGATELKIETKETADLPAHYEQLAYDTLRVLWHRKLRISAILVAAVLLVSVMLVLIGPRYSGEAIIELNFIREVPTAGAQIQPTASVDAAVIVDSAARVIRSRATASAVVARLRLDKDPAFARRSTFSYVQSVLGREAATPSPHDLAVDELMRKITVTNELRSYLISIAVTTGDPEQSANLANAVAVEYLRGQLLQQLTDAQVSAERDLNQLSSVYGVRHPNYVNGRTRLEHWDARLSALRGLPADDVVKLVRGLSLLAAQKVMVPSGPNIKLILGLTIAAALGVGIWLAWRLGPRRPVRSQRLAVLGELFFRARPRIIDLAFGFLHATERLRRQAERCFLQRATHLGRQSQNIQFGALSTESAKPAGSNTILDSSPTTFDGRHQHSATQRREP